MNPQLASYILSMSCISGDDVQVAIHRREDVVRWLKTLDHEGSSWSVVHHAWNEMQDDILGTEDITSDIEAEYARR